MSDGVKRAQSGEATQRERASGFENEFIGKTTTMNKVYTMIKAAKASTAATSICSHTME
jgi:hypothetical protein